MEVTSSAVDRSSVGMTVGSRSASMVLPIEDGYVSTSTTRKEHHP
jgi:hypothetical protein